MAGSRTSASYVNTGFIPTLTTTIELTYNRINTNGGNAIAGCSNNGRGTGGFIIGSDMSNGKWWFRILGGSYDSAENAETLNVIHTVKLWIDNDTARFQRDGELYEYTRASSLIPQQPFYLFGRRQANSVYQESIRGDIGRVRIYDVNGMARDLVPCIRKADNVVGFYDLCGSTCAVTNTPFYIPYTSENDLVSVTR